MKALILNGSPRQGNIKTAVAALEEGIKAANADIEVETVRLYDYQIKPCYACDRCVVDGEKVGCQVDPVSKELTDKFLAADVVVYGVPVYWWGMPAQMKMFLDKYYGIEGKMAGKKIGAIVIGGSEITHNQYNLIQAQFDEIAAYQGMEMIFYEKIYAWMPDELAQNEAELEVIKGLGKVIAEQ